MQFECFCVPSCMPKDWLRALRMPEVDFQVKGPIACEGCGEDAKKLSVSFGADKES